MPAHADTVFRTPHVESISRPYHQYKNQNEQNEWNNLFVPITEG